MAFNLLALFALCLCLHPFSSLAQFGPYLDAPTDVVAGTPAVATILPLNLYNYDPEFVSSYTVYLTAAATSGRLDLGADFLQEQCEQYLLKLQLTKVHNAYYILTGYRLSGSKYFNLRSHDHHRLRSRVV